MVLYTPKQDVFLLALSFPGCFRLPMRCSRLCEVGRLHALDEGLVHAELEGFEVVTATRGSATGHLINQIGPILQLIITFHGLLLHLCGVYRRYRRLLFQ